MVKLLLQISALACFLLLGSCATLPDAHKVVKESATPETPPTIIGSTRQLSPKASKAVIDRLKRQALPTDLLQRHITVEESISGTPLVAGNKVTLLVDGPATYDAMYQAIQNAKEHINFETYIFDNDEVGRSFAELLLKKAAEGVQVNLIYDSVGSIDTPFTFFQRLREGGVKVLEFNPVNPLDVHGDWTLTHRDHRKLLIVDGSLLITGGVNITSSFSQYLSKSFDKDDKQQLAWRDTDVQIEGPAVAEFQKLFLDTWKKENGPELKTERYFHPLKRAGNSLVRVIGSTPGEGNRLTYLIYVSAIIFANKSAHLTSSYFVPDEQMLKALTDAAERGVDVKIILPSNSDSKLAYYAGRSYYTQLLKSGVKLYEHRSAILHAKTAVIDGIWSSVGSTNMDLWSFLRNDEVNAVILGQGFANQMETMFNNDLGNSMVIDLEKWEQRPFSERIKESLSRLWGYWL